ncbi:MAG: HEAT repeat domain-containing protein [Candidatus Eremiobacteraeota bacterium]|nr:HEAT repeat domain-containing protein [Candidatus Eremiobacteraeota bacterium]
MPPHPIELLEQVESWQWPPATGQVLVAIFKTDQNQDMRCRAALMLGDLAIFNEQIGQALLAAVRDADQPVDVRAAAAVALGPALEQTELVGFDDLEFDPPPLPEELFEQIQETFHDLSLDPTQPALLRRRTLEASVRAPEAWHRESVEKAWKTNDSEWQITAVFCMGYLPGFEDKVLEALKSPYQMVVNEAVFTAAERGMPEVFERLATMARDGQLSDEQRFTAIGGLGAMATQESVAVLNELSTSTHEEIARAAKEALMDAQVVAELDGVEEEWPEEDDFEPERGTAGADN